MDQLFSWVYVGNSTVQHVILDQQPTKTITICKKDFDTSCTVKCFVPDKHCLKCEEEINKMKKLLGWI